MFRSATRGPPVGDPLYHLIVRLQRRAAGTRRAARTFLTRRYAPPGPARPGRVPSKTNARRVVMRLGMTAAALSALLFTASYAAQAAPAVNLKGAMQSPEGSVDLVRQGGGGKGG